jgi:archaemetzincin
MGIRTLVLTLSFFLLGSVLACEKRDVSSARLDAAPLEASPTPTPEPSRSVSKAPRRSEVRAIFQPSDAFAPMPPTKEGDWLSEHSERGQTYGQFVRSSPNKATGTRNTIYLQPIGKFDSPAQPRFDVLAEYASLFFGMPVKVLPSRDDLRVTSRKNRYSGTRQLLSTDVLNYLQWRVPADGYALIALTDIDLFPAAKWNFVLGQASLKARVGVYSLARYDPLFENAADRTPLKEVKKIVLRRALKVMTHELGHMFGIHHCVEFSCLMNGTNHLAETDRLPMHVCPVDLRKLHRAVRFDARERYRKLAEFYRRAGFESEAKWADRRASSGSPLARAPGQ